MKTDTDGSTDTIAEVILRRFRGRADVVAVGNNNGFAPHYLKNGQRMRPSWLRKHLDGERCLGFYLMDEDSRVRCSCVDFDNKDADPDPRWREKAEKVYFFVAKLGMSPVVEISQSGAAAHVWIFFDQPQPAYVVREFWLVVSRQAEVAFHEVYPRQDRLKEDGIGNLVRYPLWNQSRFVDVENDWEPVEDVAAELSRETVSEFELLTVIARLGGNTHPPAEDQSVSQRVTELVSRDNSLVGRRWNGDFEGLNDPTRSACAQSLVCELVRLYVPTHEVENALRTWCEKHDYDKGQREDWIQKTVAKAYQFVVGRKEEKSKNVTTLADACREHLDFVASGKRQHIATGVGALDDSIDGLAPGEMAIVAAQTGHGKTAFALQWIRAAAKAGMPTLILSEEMSTNQLGNRTLLSISDIPEDGWKSNMPAMRETIDDEFSQVSPVYVVESCGTIDRCEEVIEQFATIHGVKLVAVDYLQLLGGRTQNRYELVTEVSTRLKRVARRSDVSLIVLCQMNREIEKRDGKQPKLSDLRESGQIEQDADLIMFLQWPCKFDRDQPKDTYWIYVGKRRNGPIRQDRLEVKFDSSRQAIGQPQRVSVFDEWNGG